MISTKGLLGSSFKFCCDFFWPDVRGIEVTNEQPKKTEITSRITEKTPKEKAKHFPKALIIGVKKGGTGTLRYVLSLHPKIVTCDPEINFFNDLTNFNRGLTYYRSRMPQAYQDQVSIFVS